MSHLNEDHENELNCHYLVRVPLTTVTLVSSVLFVHLTVHGKTLLKRKKRHKGRKAHGNNMKRQVHCRLELINRKAHMYALLLCMYESLYKCKEVVSESSRDWINRIMKFRKEFIYK